MSDPGLTDPREVSPLITTRRDWDMVVVGAGPAGSTAACLGAAAGRSVLLVERQSWPRSKVCGGCLNARTLRLLRQVGELPVGFGALARWLQVYSGRCSARWPLPEGRIVDRSELDAWLVERARAAGTRFVSRCRARIGPAVGEHRQVELVWGLERAQVRARLVIDASGLASQQRKPDRRSAIRLGFGQTVVHGPAAYEPGTIHMVVGSSGYVGLVRLADGRLQVAACLRADSGSRQRVGDRIDGLLTDAGLPPLRVPGKWRGTPPLRRFGTRLWCTRLVRVGDAAGFWEPFTGEGIGWAVESALRSYPAVLELASSWSTVRAQQWAMSQRKWLWRCYRHSRTVARFATRPVMVRTMLSLSRTAPGLIDWVLPGQRLVCTQPRAGGTA